MDYNKTFRDLRHKHNWQPISGADMPMSKVHQTVFSHIQHYGRILDAGCGNGYFTCAMLGYGKKAEGCDIAPAAVEFCKKHFKGKSKQQFFKWDLHRPLAKKYEAIVCLDVLDQVEDGFDVIENLYRAVEDDGMLIVAAPTGTRIPLGKLRAPKIETKGEGFSLFIWNKGIDTSHGIRYACLGFSPQKVQSVTEDLNRGRIRTGYMNWSRMLGGDIITMRDLEGSPEKYNLIHVHLSGITSLYPLRIMQQVQDIDPRPLIMVSIDYSIELWKNLSPDLWIYQEMLQLADLVVNQHEEATLYWQDMLGKTCYTLPHPAEVERIKKHASEPKDRQGLIFIHHGKYGDDQQHLGTFIKEGLNVGPTAILGGQQTAGPMDSIGWSEVNFDKALDWMPQEEVIEKCLPGYRYGIDLHPHHTGSRQGVEMAALGLPCIGYDTNESYKRCFPALTISHAAVAQGRRKLAELTTNTNFYEACRGQALEAVEYYRFENVLNLLQEAIEDATGQRFCGRTSAARPEAGGQMESAEGAVGDHLDQLRTGPPEPHAHGHPNGAGREPELPGAGSANHRPDYQIGCPGAGGENPARSTQADGVAGGVGAQAV